MNLHDLIKNKDVAGIKAFMMEHNLKIEGNKIVPKNDNAQKYLKEKMKFWDQRQLARKILLNSLNY